MIEFQHNARSGVEGGRGVKRNVLKKYCPLTFYKIFGVCQKYLKYWAL